MIRLHKVKKVYNSNHKEVIALKEINLEIQKGEIYGIIGYSGAGKSTLIRLINMLEKPTEGEIWVDGRQMNQLSQKELRKARQEIGMIFQHFNLLWSRTVWENIAFPLEIAGVPKEEIDQRVKELIDLVGLTERANAYPSELSGGQKQRVGIARALANRPKVLLSDEATSALDPKTTDSILDLLQEINRKLGITIILITHEMHVIQKICHKVAVLDQGEIVEEGPVLEVFTHPKQKITKEFVKQVTEHQDTEETIRHIPHEKGSYILKCTFVGENANQPIISRWVKTLDVEPNILEGNIQYVQGSSYGSLYIQLKTTEDQLNASIEFLKNCGVEVEVIENVAGTQ
ncbi:methionine ABC transporter ATP-binding protein [Tepidibacillus sp. LV47]|uniref:methionine ABC transporter ATP-binding protein n=1 Tax=Tepidibacillus sp. LV47 TaxID=3398228 RepID=UPI003AAF677C